MSSLEGKNLNAAMLYYMFDSANMHRWNDHFRTVDLTELDKQAHKAIIAWILGKCEEDAGNTVDWVRIIKNSLFSFLQRIAITDLKPPVYYRIMENHKDEVNEFAIEEFSRLVPNMDSEFKREFREYLSSEHKTKEDNILSAAHYIATRYEFDLIKGVNQYSYGIEETEKQIEDQVNSYLGLGLAGMEDIASRNSDLYKFINLVGQLRCQQRWARAPREPKTTVLGHCIFVANAIYLHDRDVGAGPERIYNDYYSGLFHDLPEVLTKDVITPVKNSSIDLPKVIEEIENDMFDEKVRPLLPERWIRELEYMALDPFSEKPSLERDHVSLKACDHLAAWIEAHVSIQYGIYSKILREAKVQIAQKLLVEKKGESIGAAKIILDFENLEI